MNIDLSHKEIIEGFIYDYPVCEFYHLDTKDLVFSDEVRIMCQNESRNTNRTWKYPLALDSIEKCREKCGKFKNAIIFTSIAEVNDALDFDCCVEAERGHAELSRDLQEKFREHFGDTLTLATSCAICENCTFPEKTCQHPEKQIFTIEGHGLQIMKTIESMDICCNYGNKVATYVSLILFNA